MLTAVGRAVLTGQDLPWTGIPDYKGRKLAEHMCAHGSLPPDLGCNAAGYFKLPSIRTPLPQEMIPLNSEPE